MCKKLIIGSVALVFFLGVLASISSYADKTPANFGKPFQKILNLLHNVKERVADLEDFVIRVKKRLALIWGKLNDHEERITDLERQPQMVALQAYDADGQHLGIVTDRSQFYNLALDRFIQVNPSDGRFLYIGTISFTESNCLGTAYSATDTSYKLIVNAGEYFIGEKVEPARLEIKSLRGSDYEPHQCRNLSPPTSNLVVPVKKVDPPIEFPVALPVSYEIKPINLETWIEGKRRPQGGGDDTGPYETQPIPPGQPEGMFYVIPGKENGASVIYIE